MSGPAAIAGDIQAVVFCLGAEKFALPVAMVREILDCREASRLPGAPGWLLGLTDVRGTSVPVVDLRLRLGLDPAEATPASRVLVVDLPRDGGAGDLVLGLLVDRVLDVSDFAAAAVEDVPGIGARWPANFIRAVMRREDGFVVLLDTDGVFADDDSVTLLGEFDQAA
ncbi:MAG: chemotaxis protein CheW [Sphingomonadales bacterium]|nr:chemotaxis protein CheW [Sphingomonadales bacterium]